MSDTTPKKSKRSSKKHSSSPKSEPKGKVLINSKKPNYYTPFNFEPERLIFGKVQEMKGLTADNKPYTYYDIDLMYRYPNGSVGKPCCKYGDYIPISNIIFKNVPREAVLEDPKAAADAKKVKVSYNAKTAVACLVFDTNQPEIVRRSDYDTEFDGDDMISMGDLVKMVMDDRRGFFARFNQRVATAIKDGVPSYADTEENIIASYAKTSNPQHPKMGPKDKTPNKSRPKQIYYDIKSFSYLSDKTNPDSLKHVRASIKLANGFELDWEKDELDKQILRGDIFVETKTLRVKESNGWNLKSSIDPIIVTSQKEKENESSNRANDSLSHYQNNKEVISQSNAIQEQLLLKRMKKMSLDDKKPKPDSTSSESSLPNESTSSYSAAPPPPPLTHSGNDSDSDDDIEDKEDDIMSIINKSQK